MDAVRRNSVSWERLAGTSRCIKRQRIVNNTECRGIENALLLLYRRRVGNGRLRPPDSGTLIGAEKEGLVLTDRAAYRSAKLVLVVGRRARRYVKEILSVQMVVAQKLINAGMEFISTRPY